MGGIARTNSMKALMVIKCRGLHSL